MNNLEKYIAVVITLIGLIKIVELFINNFNIIKSASRPMPGKDVTYKQVMDDLLNIVHYKCMIANRRILQPLIDKALNSKPLLNDRIVNEVTLQITQEILDEMSEEYKKKLLSIYNQDKLEEVILELVYNTVTEMSLEINKKSIKNMSVKRAFKTLNKYEIEPDE